jgi:hypothetical protein
MELKQIRVGFVPNMNVGNPGVGAPGIAIGRPGMANNVQLQGGMDGLFYLTKHPTGDFHIVANRNRPDELRRRRDPHRAHAPLTAPIRTPS